MARTAKKSPAPKPTPPSNAASAAGSGGGAGGGSGEADSEKTSSEEDEDDGGLTEVEKMMVMVQQLAGSVASLQQVVQSGSEQSQISLEEVAKLRLRQEQGEAKRILQQDHDDVSWGNAKGGIGPALKDEHKRLTDVLKGVANDVIEVRSWEDDFCPPAARETVMEMMDDIAASVRKRCEVVRVAHQFGWKVAYQFQRNPKILESNESMNQLKQALVQSGGDAAGASATAKALGTVNDSDSADESTIAGELAAGAAPGEKKRKRKANREKKKDNKATAAAAAAASSPAAKAKKKKKASPAAALQHSGKKCHKCGSTGHLWTACPKRKQ